jgi:hypothetical protein
MQEGITKRCPHCDTALEFTLAGKRVVFTAHDETFCNIGTRERVRLLERAMLSQREAYERSFDRLKRSINTMLVEHGLPTLEDREVEFAEAARAKMAVALAPGAMFRVDRQ